MIWLRAYLLIGLVAHKLLWEVLKRRDGAETAGRPRPSPVLRLVKVAKIAVLIGVLAQTVLPEIFPVLADPFPLRVTGLFIYTLGLAVAVLARVQLGANWSDIEEARVREGQALISSGIYRYVRHPIYAGDFALLLGLELALNSWLVLAVVGLAPLVVRRAVREERMLAAALPEYERYCACTKRFIPFLV